MFERSHNINITNIAHRGDTGGWAMFGRSHNVNITNITHRGDTGGLGSV